MKKIKIWFSDFYPGFDPQNNTFYHFFSEFYILELNQSNPDYLIYSCHGNNFLNYDCIRIFYTGENLRPDFNLCDYAIGFDYLDFNDRYLRFPNFALYGDQFEQLVNSKTLTLEEITEKKYFCNFVYSNSFADPGRDLFFHLLNRYKKVVSPGQHLNNISLPVGDRYAVDWMFTKIGFMSKCKFSIAFENSSSPGYTTEKILHAFISNTIPIYWGDPDITKDFNPKAFINCHEFENFWSVIERIKEIDQEDELYLSIINEPAFTGNAIPENLRKNVLLDFLSNIFDQKKENAFRRPKYGTVIKYENSLKELIALQKKVQKLSKYLNFFRF